MLTGNIILGLTTYNPQGGPINYRSYQELLDDVRYVTCLVVGRKVCPIHYYYYHYYYVSYRKYVYSNCNIYFIEQVYLNKTLVRENYGSTALVRATAGERIGVEHCSDGKIFFLPSSIEIT